MEPVSPGSGQAVTPPAVRLQRNATSAARRPYPFFSFPGAHSKFPPPSPFPRHPRTRAHSTLVALAAQAGVVGLVAALGSAALFAYAVSSLVLMAYIVSPSSRD
jgi:hypothetical protein